MTNSARTHREQPRSADARVKGAGELRPPLTVTSVVVRAVLALIGIGLMAGAVRTTLGAGDAFDPGSEGFWIRIGLGSIGFALLLVAGVPLVLSIVDDRTRRVVTGTVVDRVRLTSGESESPADRLYALIDHGDGVEAAYSVRLEVFGGLVVGQRVRMTVSGLTRHPYSIEALDEPAELSAR